MRQPPRRPQPGRTSSSTTSTTCATRSPAPSTRCSSCRRPRHGWPTGGGTPRRSSPTLVLPVAGGHDDGSLPAQQRRPEPAGRARRSTARTRWPATCAPPATSTYIAGKFLTTWPKTKLPPCFTDSTVMWGGYTNVAVKVDGVSQTGDGLLHDVPRQPRDGSTSPRPCRPAPFLLYETPQAPHWVNITNPDGTTSRLAVPDTQVRRRRVGTCSGVPEADRSDKPAYVRNMNFTTAQAPGDVPEPAASDHDCRRRVRGDDAAAVRPRRPRQHPGHPLLRQWLHVGRARPLGEVRTLRAVHPSAAAGALARPLRARDGHHPHGLVPRPAADDARGCGHHPASECTAAGR